MMRKMPIIITGGGQRLGLACAKALLAQGMTSLLLIEKNEKVLWR